jgi:hypothetical protein
MNSENAEMKPEKARQAVGILVLVFFLLLGVVMPVLTLGVELFTHMCAGLLFDPIPSVFHVLLIAVVPVANLALILALRSGRGDRWRLLGWLNALALGIGGYYALLFLPFTPFALLGLLFFGFGALPLSPLTSFITAILLRVRARKALIDGSGRRLAGLWGGVTIALLAMAALEAPKAITQVGLQMAVSDDAALQGRGLRILRTGGSREAILESCYLRGGLAGGDLIRFLFNEFGTRVTQDQAREIYYRVTGTPFNMVKPPQSPLGRRGGWDWMDFDPNVGGDAVQGRIRGLSLFDSRQDSVVSPDSGVVYTEWTMVFKNTSPRQQEARAVVMLPPGGVVSRLTLWIDGEEREAAFGGRSQVKQAYQQVVQRRRDPVLVTTAGPDRVLVQCFPVPPENGTMKIRIGVTAPVDLDAPDQGVMRLPYFTEHNFALPETLAHGLWVESPEKVVAIGATTNLVEESTASGGHALRGVMPGLSLEQATAIRVMRNGVVSEVVSADSRGATNGAVQQVIRETTVAAPRRVVVVLDGSQRMKAYREVLAQWVAAIPDGVEFGVVLAGDRAVELCAMQPATERLREQAAGAIRKVRFAGGCDNVKALERAWDMAAGAQDGAILWLHATQPVMFGGVESLRQRWERRPDNPVLLSLQFATGPDVIVSALADLSAVRQIGRTGDPAADAAHYLALWAGKARHYEYARSRVEGSVPETVKAGSSHCVRLWARDEVLRLASARNSADKDGAVLLANRYQVVTPVSGAVVLETKEQFKAAGLEPVAADSVPTVPEPETWMLMAVGAMVILVTLVRRWCRASP